MAEIQLASVHGQPVVSYINQNNANIFVVRHGFSGFSSTLSQFLWFTAESVLDTLRIDSGTLTKESRDALLSTLLLVFMGLHENGKSVFFAQGVFQVFKSRLLPDEALLLGRYIADEHPATGAKRKQDLIAFHNQCKLPMNLSSTRVDPEHTMQSLIRATADVSMDPEAASAMFDSSDDEVHA